MSVDARLIESKQKPFIYILFISKESTAIIKERKSNMTFYTIKNKTKNDF